VSLAAKQVTNIVAGLSRWDPVRAGTYQRNGAAYVAKLEELGRRMHESLKPLRSRDIVTFHEAFPYFAAEFGLRVAAVVEREPGSEPSARELAETIRLVRRTGVKALFAEPQYSAKAAEAIAAESGARVFVLDPVVTGPAEANAYLEAMERNRRELLRALE
jgi:zinc transport system substrate-binding protein